MWKNANQILRVYELSILKQEKHYDTRIFRNRSKVSAKSFLIGAGPIGAGWAAYFLSQGYKVSVYLHEASEKDVLHNLINTAWSSLEALGLSEGASRDNLFCSTDLADAVNGTEFIQESVPENLALKQKIYAQLGKFCSRKCCYCFQHFGLAHERNTSPLFHTSTNGSWTSFQSTLFAPVGRNCGGKNKHKRRR
ncbi:MAG: hypothetical protein Ct9H300mP21_00980 [Pseudomonadota bacterium]|nr:MAG: hypothetical protein Ct9H300mP21_00980 [Pseudomonadota bacterium]